VPFVGWRQSMTDEQWIDLGAMEDDDWYDRIQADFGIDARVEPRSTVGRDTFVSPAGQETTIQ
jgi:hypothetical protein